MRNNTKGISAVVATVLIILITVAAITIIWAAIIPMIKNTINEGSDCLDAVQNIEIVPGFTCIVKSGTYTEPSTPGIVLVAGSIFLQIKKGTKDTELKDIQILLTKADGNTDTVNLLTPNFFFKYDLSVAGSHTSSPVVPGNNEQVTFVRPLINTINPPGTVYDSIKIAPIIKSGAGTKTCDAGQAFKLAACGA